jgi:hypothetical protein
MMSLIDNKGGEFEMGLVIKILAPERYAETLLREQEITLRFRLDDKNTEKQTRTLGVAAYAAAVIESLCDLEEKK